MKNLKNKIVAVCLLVGVLMTIFPPQQIKTLSGPDSKLYGENIEYRLIVGKDKKFAGTSFYETSSIAFDRLLLQYLILIGFGFAVYLFSSKEENEQ